MKGLSGVIVESGGVIPIGARRVTRAGSPESGVERYHIWLPKQLNNLWRRLFEEDVKVYVYIEIPAERGARPPSKPQRGEGGGPVERAGQEG